MRRTRAAYHYAVRYIKKNNSDIVRQRFASAIVENRNRDFWHEVKKVCGKSDIQRTVDGQTQSDSIANIFANKYEELYMSDGYDEVEMDGLRRDIEDTVNEIGYDSNCIIKFANIINAVSKLKPGKHDGHFGLSSDHVSNACDELFIHTAMLMSALVMHGYVTDDLAFNTVLPIPKGKNLNYSDSTNYRGIALSSISGKIFYLYVLSRYESCLSTSNFQFRFKRGHSTSMCTTILKETIDYYWTNGNDFYCTTLDAIKAFDRVQYCKLIRLLLIKKLPTVVIRFLLNIYLFQATQVAWNRSYSPGAVLSPVLFCIHFNELLHALESARCECYIGFCFIGVLAYADDLVLLAHSASATRRLLEICDEFGESYSVIFVANKSK
jgi:Reverse transcriptase (RNA-dependent DNA polymerase)